MVDWLSIEYAIYVVLLPHKGGQTGNLYWLKFSGYVSGC
jgi:hypothetical protein